MYYFQDCEHHDLGISVEIYSSGPFFIVQCVMADTDFEF